MLCGPFALRRTTGIDVDEICLRIRALRETRGERVSLRGGTRVSELKAVAAMYGWTVRRVFQFKRVRLADLAKRITKGRWIFHQRDHLFGVRSAQHLRETARRSPNAGVITAAYRVYRRAGKAAPAVPDSSGP